MVRTRTENGERGTVKPTTSATPELESQIWKALETVTDPELPISVTDLGLIQNVTVDGGIVRVKMIPTYSACPAIEVMRQDIQRRLLQIPRINHVDVQLSFDQPWTMNRMSDRGRRQLVQHGLSMPANRQSEMVECPFCGSTNTRLESLFGPTLCRAIYYCLDCKNPIERFRTPADE